MNSIRRKAVPRYAALSISILAVLASRQAAQAACVLRTDLTPQTWICDGVASANTSGQTIVFSPTVTTASTAAGFGVDVGNTATALTLTGAGSFTDAQQSGIAGGNGILWNVSGTSAPLSLVSNGTITARNGDGLYIGNTGGAVTVQATGSIDSSGNGLRATAGDGDLSLQVGNITYGGTYGIQATTTNGGAGKTSVLVWARWSVAAPPSFQGSAFTSPTEAQRAAISRWPPARCCRTRPAAAWSWTT